jgi:penicillin-binding protein activator
MEIAVSSGRTNEEGEADMSRKSWRISQAAFLCIGALHLAGCAAFRAKVSDVDVEKNQHIQSTYDYSDMRDITQSVVNELLGSKFLLEQKAPPVLMIAGVQNRTSRYVDTKNLTDRMRKLLFDSGKVQFVNETRREELLKEQGYQAANVTPETQVKIGRQIGAKYMVSGSFTEMESSSPRQVRVSKEEINYYKLTIEVTDLETSKIEFTTEKEFARKARVPLIRW